MGLDMYLEARKNINKIDWQLMDRDSNLSFDEMTKAATTSQWSDVVKAAKMTHLPIGDIYGVTVAVNVGYWRKVNAIHKWFVDNVQNGQDNCGEYYVSIEQLNELLTTCQLALSHKDPKFLPPSEGFFFGGTDIDEWYWLGIEDTIKQLKPLVLMPELSYYYSSSW